MLAGLRRSWPSAPATTLDARALEPAGEEAAEIAVPAQGVLVADDREMGEVLRPALRQLVHGVDRGDGVPGPELAVELEAGPGIDDRPGMDDLAERVVRRSAGEVELLLALEEEGPLLVVKQGVALVEIDLAGVGLDLAEVGVDGAVEDELGGQAVLPRQAEVRSGPSRPRGSRPSRALVRP